MSEIKDLENVGTGVLIIKDNKVLLGRRLGGTYLSGYFGVPGGRVAQGESLIEAAKRELQEEVGIVSLDLEFVGLVNDNQRGRTFLHSVFVCKKYEGIVTTMEPDKCEGWNWFELFKLPDNLVPGHRAGIEMYESGSKLCELL